MKQSIITELMILKDKFITYLSEQKKMAKHTVHSYKLDMDALIYFVEKNEKLNSDIPNLLVHYGLFLHESSLSKASIARKTSCLRTFCRFLQSQGFVVDVMPKRPFFKEKKPVFFQYHRLLELFDSSQKEQKKSRFYIRERAIWELLLATGIRCNEIITLTVADLDLEMRYVAVQDSKSRKRILSFDERTCVWLKMYVEQERELYEPKEQYLFLNNFGYKLTSRAIQRSLKLLTRLTTISDEITPHTLRHSYAMHLLSQHVSHESLKELLGLRSSETVEKYLYLRENN